MDLFDLTGKTAVVTGGGRGIGAMIAGGLVDAGASVVIVSRAAAALDATAQELRGRAGPGQSVTTYAADLASPEACATLAEQVGEQLGGTHAGLDILVNNSGATWGAPLADFPASGWDKVLDLNVKTPFFLVQAFLPLLTAAGTAEDPARVINIGSIDGIRTPMLPTYSYSASKAAIHQLTRVLAMELGPQHVTVNAIAPGPFESKMMAATLRDFGEEIAASVPLGRIGRPDDMAGAVVFLAGRAGSYVTGTVIPVDGGLCVR